jgi:hypothetical protein
MYVELDCRAYNNIMYRVYSVVGKVGIRWTTKPPGGIPYIPYILYIIASSNIQHASLAAYNHFIRWHNKLRNPGLLDTPEDAGIYPSLLIYI